MAGMTFVQTDLGRMVDATDKATIARDSILKTLLDFRINPHNPNNKPLAMEGLARVTCMEPNRVAALLESLIAEGLVELCRHGWDGRPPAIDNSMWWYRITGKGVAYTMNIPQGSVGLGLM